MPTDSLTFVFHDQLDAKLIQTTAADGPVFMAEATVAPSGYTHKRRLAFQLSAMRHFRDRLRQDHVEVDYRTLEENDDWIAALRGIIEERRPRRVMAVRPGDLRHTAAIKRVCAEMGVGCEIQTDPRFYTNEGFFADFAAGRKALRHEHFYRRVRNEWNILLENDGSPVGGAWNFDQENRDSFGKEGPGPIPGPQPHSPDDTTAEVLREVERLFPDNPGSLAGFVEPVQAESAKAALLDFVAHRLPLFGRFQDAMWTGTSFLYHSHLSGVINLGLLSPREAVEAVLTAYGSSGESIPLAAVEGFVRQVIGWREYVAGIYYHYMPEYAEKNGLGADLEIPEVLWTGETEMACIADAMQNLLENGYAHHIQRLMVLGLWCLLLGVRPTAVHRWHMEMYADAYDWVSLPNVLGMSQFADGGLMAGKPYCASGAYINRMSNYCRNCRFDPKRSVGEDGCPITTLYWDFLQRNKDRLATNRRMGFYFKNLDRKDKGELAAVRRRAESIRSGSLEGI